MATKHAVPLLVASIFSAATIYFAYDAWEWWKQEHSQEGWMVVPVTVEGGVDYHFDLSSPLEQVPPGEILIFDPADGSYFHAQWEEARHIFAKATHRIVFVRKKPLPNPDIWGPSLKEALTKRDVP